MNSHEIQSLLDDFIQDAKHARSLDQLTLGKLIKQLEAMPPNKKIEGLGDLDSYRGYYSDLAFEPIEGKVTAKKLLKKCRAAMGKTFEGYKGGDFLMDETTPLWVSDYGTCGLKLMAINADGSIETEADPW